MSKSDKVIAELKTGRSLTPLECWQEFGVYRMAVIVNRYRKKHGDYSIKTNKMELPDGTTYANYQMTWN